MNENVEYIRQVKIERTIEALKFNGINGYFAKDHSEVLKLIEEIIPKGSFVAAGDSHTLKDIGVFDFLDEFYDNYHYDKFDMLASRQIFSTDAFFSSANAITEEGDIYNVDGLGNRVAPTIWGPEKVIFVVGANKIVPDVEAAIKRNREVSAPTNAKRWGFDTPCVKTGHCMDCNHPRRICREYTLIRKQRDKTRMHVIFLNEDLGF